MAANHKIGRDHTAIDIRNEKCKKCIFRVPNVLRRQNPEAYTPDVVSIGPFHHDPETRAKEEGKGGKEGIREKDFQLIERVKQSYLNEILVGMNITTLEGLTAEVIKLSDQKSDREGGFEQRAREFYAESLDHIPSKDFTEIMIVDGCFLLQLFRKFNHPDLRAFDDLVFNMDCMFHFLCHDILLLENQLPWFVIHSLYNLTHKLYPSEDSLSTLILEAFSTLPSLKQSCSSYKNHLHRDKFHFEGRFLHILDLLRSSIVIPLRTIEKRDLKDAGKEGISNGPAEEHQVRSGSSKYKRDDKDIHGAIFDPDLHQIRTATDLSKADIKFESVTRESIMDIRFEEGRFCRNGILKIPKLNIGMSSETLFRNFIAIEQCYHDYLNEITSYAILMDNLISSQDDMDLLCKKKVIGNWMSDEDGCKFFSNLYKDIPHNKFYYVGLCKQVNDCYSSKWYTWLALLKSEKFSNPWRILAFGIGIFILILTAWSQSNNIRVNMHKW
ncbi:PREDICTED: UPF0481 protein At3g47200-like [Fragaria vesca subsp. vesca]|uniref:UPF0481 protein At3g47200-like n=1 Tax=Fragaria vesca subsp. vesca TaxID=101020 RepID=UPI0002C36CBE|nr:PREDICTED: UPF0481 protein At3g47200-like [Fragaria vesca subsp. vesca]XP_011467819.1 PREDICTED: UPF0481 protein At3g47200-like [Fragaria vesca subsp. vesca]